MESTHTRRLYVGYGSAGAVGSIRETESGFAVTMTGASEPLGEYPNLAIAKNALCSHLGHGAPRPEFHEH
ncbi:methyltransferase [Microbacterium sp. G2-8]|uniref:methyltransferase n=1 Tax=Microbacterium sp. G2-8 TaxID=2842454 RepID=UPI001C8A0CAD|nr:methyltransferase [Microbacterium sp. G2-8]